MACAQPLFDTSQNLDDSPILHLPSTERRQKLLDREPRAFPRYPVSLDYRKLPLAGSLDYGEIRRIENHKRPVFTSVNGCLCGLK